MRNVLGRGLASASTHRIKLKLLSAAGKFIIRPTETWDLIPRCCSKIATNDTDGYSPTSCIKHVTP
jgi:hypothetical protein